MRHVLVVASLAVSALAAAAPASAAKEEIRILVDRSDRKVYVRRGTRVLRVADVAVGKPGHLTPLGHWAFHQVDINPDWTPPDSAWSRDSSYTPAGHPDNPMGRARLIFNRPYTIHGTDDVRSLGKAASHGSIRVANPVAIQLAELLLKEGKAWRGRRWFQRMLATPNQMYKVTLKRPVPIDVVE